MSKVRPSTDWTQARGPFGVRNGSGGVVHSFQPPRGLVIYVAAEEAAAAGVSVSEVLGVCWRKRAMVARRRAWLRLLNDHACSVLGIATVWGCDRRSIQRARARGSA